MPLANNDLAFMAQRGKMLQQQQRKDEEEKANENAHKQQSTSPEPADNRPDNIMNDGEDVAVPLLYRGAPLNHPLPGSEMTRLSQAFALEASTQQASTEAGQQETPANLETSPCTSPDPRATSFTNDNKSSNTDTSGFPSINTLLQTSHANTWKPLAIRTTPALSDHRLAYKPLLLKDMTHFTKSFLLNALGGKEFSPGFYWSPGCRMLDSETYYILDAAVEPYLPCHPSDHGAKLSVFFRDFDDSCQEARYTNFPLFISTGPTGSTGNDNNSNSNSNNDKKKEAGEELYAYFGTYSQSRWSDRLDYDRVQEQVPLSIKQHWARLLASPERATWLTEQLVKHFVPKPEYPTTSTLPNRSLLVAEAHAEEVAAYIDRLEDWFEDKDQFLRNLSEEGILAAFTKADADDPPGLRFWWEYLHCTKFDRAFYQVLASKGRE